MQTFNLKLQVSEVARWELLLKIIAQMDGVKLLEQASVKPEKHDISRFYGILSNHHLHELDDDFSQMRDEWERSF